MRPIVRLANQARKQEKEACNQVLSWSVTAPAL
jgi:hypothetical protein